MHKVTIGVTTYNNRIKFLNDSIRSVLNQTYKKFKVIIANDSPEYPITKESFDFVIDERIAIINNIKNLGEEKNMNQLLHLTSSPWFTWLADDDFLHPEFLNSKIKFLNANLDKNISAIYSNYQKVKFFDKKLLKKKINNSFYIYEKKNFHELLLQKKINCIGVYGLLNTDNLKKIKGIKKLGNSFGPFSDILIPLVLSKYGNIVWTSDFLSYFRSHDKSLSESVNYDAFYSAKSDFINEYNSQFKGDLDSQLVKKNLFYFNKWFIYSILQILKRDKSKNIFQKLKSILNFKKNIFYENISIIMSIKIIFYIFKVFFMLIFIST